MSNKQLIFDTAFRGVYAQGGRAIEREANRCVYRLGPAERVVAKCAIGHLIPDEIYTPSMEIGNVEKLMQSGSPELMPVQELLRSIMAGGADEDFLAHLQSVHDGTGDGADFRTRFAARMRRFAEINGLSAAVIDEMEAEVV